jgi:pimeloyl-ACP methyl ester carboxylesterase
MRAVDPIDDAPAEPGGRYVSIDDTRLWVVERGDGPQVFVLHGGPGLDHHEFADYLDPLTNRYRLILVDQRAQGQSDPAPESTWTIERMAQDVIMLALAMGLERYAVLGHSFGALVALQNAVDYAGQAAAVIVSCGVPSSRYFELGEKRIAEALAAMPDALRGRVQAALDAESTAGGEDLEALLDDEWPLHFADPLDPRIPGYATRARGVLSPDVLRRFASGDFSFELLDRLPEVRGSVLVLGGRFDRVCPVEGSEATAAGIRGAELVVFERSAHMPFVEEQDSYIDAVRRFLDRTLASA